MKFIQRKISEIFGPRDYWDLDGFTAMVTNNDNIASISIKEGRTIVVYDLCLMLDLPKNNIPKNKMYLEKHKNGLRYIVLNSDNIMSEGFIDIFVEGKLTKQILDKYKLDILNITSKRGHTFTVTGEVLSKLQSDKYYSYITKGYGIDTVFIECPKDKLNDVLLKIEEICKTL